jgi:predicted RNA-binding Zn ribbon-like protein
VSSSIGVVNAPADLSLVEDFLNTLDERSFRRRGVDMLGGDALPGPAALIRWLAERDLVSRSARATKRDLELAHELRAALREAVTDERDERRIDAALAKVPLRAELGEHGELRLAGVAGGVPGALAHLVAIAVRCSADGSWRRLHACAASDCRWVFYDESRSGAGRWCSMSACGNRRKTARYRARKADQPA